MAICRHFVFYVVCVCVWWLCVIIEMCRVNLPFPEMMSKWIETVTEWWSLLICSFIVIFATNIRIWFVNFHETILTLLLLQLKFHVDNDRMLTVFIHYAQHKNLKFDRNLTKREKFILFETCTFFKIREWILMDVTNTSTESK